MPFRDVHHKPATRQREKRCGSIAERIPLRGLTERLFVAYKLQMPTVRRTEEFSGWFKGLRDFRARAKIIARIDRLSLGNPGDVNPVGNGVSEMRIHYGPSYRLYYVTRGEEIVVLLCGGDKNSQNSDIATAKKLSSELEDEAMAKTKLFDAAEYLDSPDMIAAYLTEAFASDDPAAITMAIGAVARSHGMAAVAEKAGLSRENLYRALGGEAKPEFGTVVKVLRALEIDLVAQPHMPQRAA